MSDAPNNARIRILPLGLALALAGCDVDLSGLNQLLDPDPTYLVLPGRRLVGGEYKDADIGGTDAEGAFLIGREVVDGTDTLSITPMGTSNTCRAGPTDDRYRTYQFGYRNGYAFTVPFTRTEDDVTDLHFVNTGCEELLDPIPSNNLPFWPAPQPLESVPGYLTVTRDGELSLLEPWSSRTSEVSRGIRGWIFNSGKFWFHERPQDDLEEGRPGVTLRNDRIRRLGRVEGVDEFDVTAESLERIAFTRDGELFTAKTPELEPEGPIDENACRPRFPGGFRGRGISYFSPCDDRTVNVYGSARLSDPGPGKGDRKYVLKSRAAGHPAIQFLEDRAVVFLAVSDGGDPATFTLWAGYLGDELELLGDSPGMSSGTPWVNTVGKEFQLYPDWDGETSRLVRWKPGEKPREIATGVRTCMGPQASTCLVNFDGTSGDAVRVAADDGVHVLARQVADSMLYRDEYGLALVADYDGKVGDLILSRGGDEFELVARGVRATDRRFLQLLKGIVYLRDWSADDDMGSLGVRVLETGDTFDTGVRASWWREIGWPQPGLLYAVGSGDRQGVWFASLM